jgi:magnesium-transporting ATPase (P-type)
VASALASTQTLGSTSAINSDKTGTLTLNQMTAVQMTAAGRRYAVDGQGYSTAGRITRVGGQADIPLDEFLVPMVLNPGKKVILTALTVISTGHSDPLSHPAAGHWLLPAVEG